jgi:hypothetical protein
VPKQNHSRFILPVLIFSGLYLNMVSCENTQHKTIPENKDLSFNINHNLLNKTPLKNDDEFLIYSPVEWVSFDSANFTQLKRAIEANENIIQLELVGGYQSKDFATCIISKVITIKNSFEYIPENYKDILKSQFSTENINVSHINIKNNPVRQYIISNNSHTVIKLFISGVQNYQVDYIIPRGIYEAELGKVESSIGTITNKGEKR